MNKRIINYGELASGTKTIREARSTESGRVLVFADETYIVLTAQADPGDANILRIVTDAPIDSADLLTFGLIATDEQAAFDARKAKTESEADLAAYLVLKETFEPKA